MRFAFINVWKEEWPVEFLCRVMQVTSGGFRAWRSRPLSAMHASPVIPIGHSVDWPIKSVVFGSPDNLCPKRDKLCLEGHPPPLRQLHPLVAPQVLHFMQVPLRTNV